jgi:hypothetical protein
MNAVRFPMGEAVVSTCRLSMGSPKRGEAHNQGPGCWFRRVYSAEMDGKPKESPMWLLRTRSHFGTNILRYGR